MIDVQIENDSRLQIISEWLLFLLLKVCLFLDRSLLQISIFDAESTSAHLYLYMFVAEVIYILLLKESVLWTNSMNYVRPWENSSPQIY